MNGEIEIVTNEDEVTDLTVNQEVVNSLTFVPPDELPDLDNAEAGMNIAPRYMEFAQEGESIRGIYIGPTTITSKKNNELKKIKAIVLQNKDGFFLNAGASLVDQLSKMRPGIAVQVTYRGKERTNSGYEVKTYEVRLLNVKGFSYETPPQIPHKPVVLLENIPTDKGQFWNAVVKSIGSKGYANMTALLTAIGGEPNWNDPVAVKAALNRAIDVANA